VLDGAAADPGPAELRWPDGSCIGRMVLEGPVGHPIVVTRQ
jgi:hypothetical protein